MTKKLLAGLPALLLIISVLISPWNSAGVKAGPGNGKDEQITDVEELINVFEDIMLAYDGDYEDLEYSSFTCRNRTVMSGSYNMKGETAKYMINRDLTLYCEGERKYYKSVGNVSQDSNAAFFDIEIYMDDEDVFVKFNQYSEVSSSGRMDIKSKYLGKWLELPTDAMSGLAGVDGSNFDVFDTLGEIIEDAIEEHDLTLSGSQRFEVPMPEKYEADGVKTRLVLDFTVSTKPKISFIQKVSQDSDMNEGGTYYSYSVDTSSENSISFENINNTVVEFTDRSSVVKIPNSADPEDVFNITKTDSDKGDSK